MMFPKAISRVFTGYVPGKAQHLEIQCKTILLVAYVAMPTVGIFALINYYLEHNALALVELGIFMMLAFCLRLRSRPQLLPLARNIMMLCAVVVFTALFVDGGLAQSGIIWSLVVPFFAFLLMGLPVAWFWLGGYAILNAAIIAMHFHGYLTLPYDDAALLYFPATFLFFSLIAAVFELQLERLHQSHEVTINDLESLRNNLESHIADKTRALIHANEMLRREVEEHKDTAKELEHNKGLLVHAQKMEAIGTLVGGMAHDFNNMLAGMVANLYLAKNRVVDAEANQKLAIAEELCFSASKVIQQLLIFARQDNVEMTPFNLTPFIKETIKVCGSSIPANIEFESEICDQDMMIKGDTTRIQQVLMNLVNNARDALDGIESPRIAVKLSIEEAAEPVIERYPEPVGAKFARISVCDNGSGIPQKYLKHIFEPFFTTKEVGKGTGLGLAMCYGAVESHGGLIDIESTESEGTAFHIWLPLTADSPSVRADIKREQIRSGKGELIMIADDNEHMRIATSELLESMNYRVIEARNGQEAVDLFFAHQDELALIVVDVIMPKVGGLAAVEWIRKASPELPVIFCSGYARDKSLKSAMPGHGETIISKPFNVAEFSQVINKKLHCPD